MYGYQLKANNSIDRKNKLSWTCVTYITSHQEGYVLAIQEQYGTTKDTINKRDRDSNPKLSSRYQLPPRHEIAAKTIYNVIHRKVCSDVYIKGI